MDHRAWFLVGLCTFAYLYPFPFFDTIHNPNEQVRFYMTESIVDDSTYAIDRPHRARWVNDAAIFEGHYYSVKSPGTSLLGVPGYWLYSQLARGFGFERHPITGLWVVRVTASVLPMLLFLCAFRRWLSDRLIPPFIADCIALSIATGSFLYGYAILFVSHTTSAVFAFGAFMLLERARNTGHMRFTHALLAGFLSAGTTALEYPGFVASALLSIYALFCVRPWHRIIPFAIGSLIPTAAVLHFHWAAFGNPLTPGHRYLEHAPFRELANAGFFGATELSTEALSGLPFDLGYGLFPLTPILVFAFVGFPVLLASRRRLDSSIALSIVLATYLLIAFMNNWRGGWTVGPRYLALTVPFLGWAAAEGASWASRRAPRGVGAVALGATYVGWLASAGTSIYYPHLPENLTRPVPQLISVLLAHDFAPYNLGSWLSGALGVELWGTASMTPLFVCALLAVAWVLTGLRTWFDRLVVSSASVGVAMVLAQPLFVGAEEQQSSAADARAFVTRTWEPSGHDIAARLEAKVRAGDAAEPDWERLVEVYEREGRTREAEQARRRARSAGIALRVSAGE